MKSQDIVILLKIVSIEEQLEHRDWDTHQRFSGQNDPYAVRSLEASLGISKTEVSASLKRSTNASLAIRSQGHLKPNRRNLLEFIAYGLKYAFPVTPQAPERGIPTAFEAPMLKGQLLSAGSDVYVWPYAQGKKRGLSVKPLYHSVPEAALKDDRLYEYLALVDAIRLGNQREASLAQDILKQRLARQ